MEGLTMLETVLTVIGAAFAAAVTGMVLFATVYYLMTKDV